MNEVPRKPMARQLFRIKEAMPTRVVREEVSRLAREHHAMRQNREFTGWVGRRLGVPKARAERLVVGRLVEVETSLHALRLAMRNALEESVANGAEVWGDHA